MGFFSFRNNFEVAVNHPKEVVYKQFVSCIRKENWDITSSKQGEEISFQTSPTTRDYYGNPFTFYWTLEINQYGSSTQIVETSIGNYDMETYTLRYDRNNKQLYYRDGGGNVTIDVDTYSKKLYMPSEFGTMYLYKQ